MLTRADRTMGTGNAALELGQALELLPCGVVTPYSQIKNRSVEHDGTCVLSTRGHKGMYNSCSIRACLKQVKVILQALPS